MKDNDWSALYGKYEKLALRVAWQMLFTLDDVSDAVQEAVSALWLRRREIEDEAAFRAFFLGAVVNQCRKRRARYTRSMSEEPQKPEQTVSLDTPADEMLKAEIRLKVRQALLGLPEEQRGPVVLCLIEGVAYEEAAKALGMTVPALRNHLYRARKALRSALENTLG